MGAFGEFFGFDGRIDRLGFLWRSILIGVVIAALALGAIWFAHSLDPDGLAGASAYDREIITGAVLLGLWSSFALATRRLRDMGLEPAHVVPLYAALWVVNEVLLEPMSRLDPRDFSVIEGGWAALQWLAAVPLLFWPPSKRGPRQPPTYAAAGPTAYVDWRGSA